MKSKVNILSKIIKLFVLSVLLLLINDSCKTDSEEYIVEKLPDYSSSISLQRISLAKAFIKGFSSNNDLLKTTLKQCNEKFDGDRNALLVNLKELSVGAHADENFTIGEIINNLYVSETVVLKSGPIENLVEKMLQNDPLLQLYFYRSSLMNDSSSIAGIVIVPENFNESKDKEVILIKNDGTKSKIRTDVDPNQNYLVLSKNERIGHNDKSSTNKLKIAAIPDDPNDPNDPYYPYDPEIGDTPPTTPNYTTNKSMRITNASFTSMDAKRQVESWILGEPEVRVNIIYAVRNQTTNSMEPRATSFLYPQNWTYVSWFSTYSQWVGVSVDCPHWYFYEQSFDRRIQWIEEDGSTIETELTNELKDPTTGLTTTLKVKIPASTDQRIIADSYIDYYNPSAGEVNWGLIKFQLAF